MSGLVPYNITIAESSGTFLFLPHRDGPATTGWNASFTGDSVWPNATTLDVNGSGIGYRATQLAGASVELDFTGTAVYLCLSSNGQQYIAVIDGIVVSTTGPANDPACAAFQADTMIVADNLAYKAHTALIQVQSAAADQEHAFQFMGGVATIAANTTGHTVTPLRTVDDQDPGWVFVPGRGPGNWDTSIPTDTRYFNDSITFECNYGPNITATYTFTGASALQLIGQASDGNHAYSIVLDGVTTSFADMTSRFQAGPQILFFAGGLDPDAHHTIVARNYNDGDPTCAAGRFCCLNLDALVLVGPGDALYVPQATTGASTGATTSGANGTSGTSGTSGASGGSSSADSGTVTPAHHHSAVGAIAGGVVAGVVCGLVATLLLLLFCTRRRRARAQHLREADAIRAAAAADDAAGRPLSGQSQQWTVQPFTLGAAPAMREERPQPVTSPGAQSWGSGDSRPTQGDGAPRELQAMPTAHLLHELQQRMQAESSQGSSATSPVEHAAEMPPDYASAYMQRAPPPQRAEKRQLPPPPPPQGSTPY